MKFERLRVLQTLIAHLESHSDDWPCAAGCPLSGELHDVPHLVAVLTAIRDDIAVSSNGLAGKHNPGA